ncbi:hypothetical protein DUI87_23081 [Hirundo rustica rustica]|uniref:Uncharacterized protein n=1 Tax=Hirundo rustica rustica TaxID=333673 RepID=A0A3M0JJG2_HIRRU|nr:hypothetical protein DUI87_23081 [Hirundo rustica rustica]
MRSAPQLQRGRGGAERVTRAQPREVAAGARAAQLRALLRRCLGGTRVCTAVVVPLRRASSEHTVAAHGTRDLGTHSTEMGPSPTEAVAVDGDKALGLTVELPSSRSHRCHTQRSHTGTRAHLGQGQARATSPKGGQAWPWRGNEDTIPHYS